MGNAVGGGSGGPPSGAAGGDLGGTYPDPSVVSSGGFNIESAAFQPATAFDLAGAAAAAAAASLPLAGGTMSGPIAMGASKVTGLANGSGAQDAAAFGQIPLIDSTAADIQLDGVQTAGANGLTADSGHIHPATSWIPADNALLIATRDPSICQANQILTAGTVYLVKLTVRVAMTITYLYWIVEAAGSGTSAGSFTGLYSSSGTLLTGSSDIGVNLATAGTYKETLTSAQSLTAGSFVWAALLSNLTTTQPHMQVSSMRSDALNVNLTAATYQVAVNFPPATTVAAGSNTGEISTIASWATPSAGVLSVASVTGYPTTGALAVAASGSTLARVTYTGVSGSTFTGCAYVSGSATGTVATGGAVTNAALPASITPSANSQSGAFGIWTGGS